MSGMRPVARVAAGEGGELGAGALAGGALAEFLSAPGGVTPLPAPGAAPPPAPLPRARAPPPHGTPKTVRSFLRE